MIHLSAQYDASKMTELFFFLLMLLLIHFICKQFFFYIQSEICFFVIDYEKEFMIQFPQLVHQNIRLQSHYAKKEKEEGERN